jgi:hypothetical protein
MKRQAIFLFLPIFLVFFAWGLQVGNNMQEKLPIGATDPMLENKIKELPNGQKSILIFIVSKFDTHKPEVFGIWLMSYMSDEPYATILSVYPSSSQGESTMDKLITDTFQLKKVNEMHLLDDGFLNEINNKNIWFSGYILFDLKGFSEILNLSGEAINQLNDPSSESNIEQFLRLNDSSIPALLNQTLLLQQLCNKFTLVDGLSDLKLIRDQFPQHISGNLDPDILMKDWEQFIRSRNGSFCVFPQQEQLSRIDY